MDAMTGLSTMLGSLKTATDLAKILKQSTTSLQNAEINFRLAELMNALADAKVELATVQDTIIEQNRTIRELNDKLKFSGQMNYESPFYWNVADGKREGPYCSRCWEVDKIAIHLREGARGMWYCDECSRARRK